jgi:hypothetical protein
MLGRELQEIFPMVPLAENTALGIAIMSYNGQLNFGLTADYDALADVAAAFSAGVDQVPALVVEGARDYGIRFLGVPSGYEFSNLIDSIIVASTGTSGLTAETQQALAGLTGDVDIKVFSTPG